MARTKNRGNNTANSPTSYKSMRWRLGKYIRLSKEDLLRGRDESNSVVNQRLLLEQYHQTHMDEFYEGDENDVYVDDGKTGTDTDREDFQRLLADTKTDGELQAHKEEILREYRELPALIRDCWPIFTAGKSTA